MTEALYDILGQVIMVDEHAKEYGVNSDNCNELLSLVETALTHMDDKVMKKELADLRYNMALSTYIEFAFNKLVQTSIVTISEYIFPVDNENTF